MTSYERPVAVNLEATLKAKLPRENVNVVHLDEEYSVRIAKVQGRFPWHSHPHGDEGWLVWRGHLTINTEVGDVELERGDFTVVPKGVKHSPIADVDDTVVVIFNRTKLGMDLADPQADLGGFELPEESR